MSIAYATCKNCEKEFKTNFLFCPYCGQKDKEELTLRLLFNNTISNYFSVDARFFKSFLPLLSKPGYLARKFIEGKRLLYLHPAQLYLFISVVFFFLFSFNTRKQINEVNESLVDSFNNTEIIKDSITTTQKETNTLKAVDAKQENDSIAKKEIIKALKSNAFLTGMDAQEIDSLAQTDTFKNSNAINFSFNENKIDSLLKANATDAEIYEAMGLKAEDGIFKRRLVKQSLKFFKSKQGGSILQTFYDTIPVAMFFLLPIFALILKLLYFKKGRYSHHLVFSFYYFAFLFTVFSIILIVNFIVDIPDWLDFLIMLSTFIYLLIALKHFYNQKWILSFIKSGLTTFLFLAIVIPITALILILFAVMFY